MSTDGPGDLLTPKLAAGEQRVLPVSSILGICDRLLAEIGRRRHLFSWLRSPDGHGDRWLAVDAYYPGNRVVVVCRDGPTTHDRLYAELVPAHGMRLLEVRRSQLGADPAAAKQVLERMIAALKLPERRPVEPPANSSASPPGGVVIRALASLLEPPAPPPAPARRRSGSAHAAAAERAARFVARSQPGRSRAAARETPRRRPRHAPPRSIDRIPAARSVAADGIGVDAPGLVLGLALAATACLEIYLGVAVLALDRGRLALGLGIALDACARVLGTVAAGRARDPQGGEDWTWICAVGGSPVVVGFAYLRRSGPATTDPAPLAGLLAVLSIAVIFLAVVFGG